VLEFLNNLRGLGTEKEIGLSCRPAKLHRLVELVSLESILGLLKSLTIRLGSCHVPLLSFARETFPVGNLKGDGTSVTGGCLYFSFHRKWSKFEIQGLLVPTNLVAV